MAEFRIELGGFEREVEVTRQGDKLQVFMDGEMVELDLLYHDGSYLIIEYPGPKRIRKKIHVAGHLDGDLRQLWIDGHTFVYKRVRQQQSEHNIDGSLSSSIPAVVSQILVSAGDAVKTGDKLILLESMKMVIPILAPCDSTVKAIHCSTGESVQAGVPLIDLEESVI